MQQIQKIMHYRETLERQIISNTYNKKIDINFQKDQIDPTAQLDLRLQKYYALSHLYIIYSFFQQHNIREILKTRHAQILMDQLKILKSLLLQPLLFSLTYNYMNNIFYAIFFLFIVQSLGEKDYTDDINKIKSAIQDKNGNHYHEAYKKLAYITDTFGPRMWGSSALENTLVHLYKLAKQEGFQNVRLEAVKNFTKWVRGKQYLILSSPRPFPTRLKLIGLGGSIPGHIKAKAIVVSSYQQLQLMKDQVKDKIVVYNPPWKSYGAGADFRVNGAWHASMYGASAALVRSVTPHSIESVHTGVQMYNPKYPKIPIAAITTEDAEMLARMQSRNQQIILQLHLQSNQQSNSYSNNLVFDIRGSTYPDQIILLGGHIDSWDTGSQTGANDDGGGFLTCFEALRLIKNNLTPPKRTLRFIAWSGQQWGSPLTGAHAYLLAHKSQLKNHILAFQDDLGSTLFQGFGYIGHQIGKNIVLDITNKYMTPLLNASKLTGNGGGADTAPLQQFGVPTMANEILDSPDHEFYFSYHHSAGDAMTMMSGDDLDSNVLGVASMFYIIADLDTSIPKPTINQDQLQSYLQKIQEAKNSKIKSNMMFV